MLSLREVIVVAALTMMAAPTATADTIVKHKGGKIENVTIKEETYEKVFFLMKNVPTVQPFDMDNVKSVEYSEKPQDYQSAMDAKEENKFKDAIELFKQARDKVEKNSWVKQYALFQIAECYRALGQYDEAIKTYDQLVQEFPKTKFYPQTYLYKGECYRRQNKPDKAKEIFQALKQDVQKKGFPEKWKYEADYNLVLLDEAKDPAGAMTKYQELVAQIQNQFPTVANRARLQIGLVQLKQNKLDQAFSFFEEIANTPQADDEVLAGAYNGLGLCYFNKKDYVNARYAFLRVVIQYKEVTGDYLPMALYHAGRCFELLATNEPLAKARAGQLYNRCTKEFPTSEWAKRALEKR